METLNYPERRLPADSLASRPPCRVFGFLERPPDMSNLGQSLP